MLSIVCVRGFVLVSLVIWERSTLSRRLVASGQLYRRYVGTQHFKTRHHWMEGDIESFISLTFWFVFRFVFL